MNSNVNMIEPMVTNIEYKKILQNIQTSSSNEVPFENWNYEWLRDVILMATTVRASLPTDITLISFVHISCKCIGLTTIYRQQLR